MAQSLIWFSQDHHINLYVWYVNQYGKIALQRDKTKRCHRHIHTTICWLHGCDGCVSAWRSCLTVLERLTFSWLKVQRSRRTSSTSWTLGGKNSQMREGAVIHRLLSQCSLGCLFPLNRKQCSTLAVCAFLNESHTLQIPPHLWGGPKKQVRYPSDLIRSSIWSVIYWLLVAKPDNIHVSLCRTSFLIVCAAARFAPEAVPTVQARFWFTHVCA